MDQAAFKVVVVGGGPAGLVAAHALTKAGIDFVVLEGRSSVAPELGAGVGFWPMSLRILDQLDILEQIRPLLNAFPSKNIILADGGVLQNFPLKMDEYLGEHFYMCHRADLLQTLYDTLPDAAKARVLTGKRVQAIEVSDSGVRVGCEDGSWETGSIVFGADGVHSKVRRLAREAALEENPEAKTDPVQPFLTSFEGLFGNSPLDALPSFSPGELNEVHSFGTDIQVFAGRERVWWIVYHKLDEPTREPLKYSDKDRDAFADKVGHLHISDKLTFRDIYAVRNSGCAVALEEGSLKHWGWKRIVMLGDSSNKMTANLGMGMNCAIQDVVILVNHLRSLLSKMGAPGSGPSAAAAETIDTPTLERLFDAYWAEHNKFSPKFTYLSARDVRICSWSTYVRYFLDRWLYPPIGMRRFIFRFIVARFMSRGRVFDFLEIKNNFSGTVPWTYSPKNVASSGKGAKL
ncbi:hypothetical protein B0T24DRAFT_288829 [Lasiosphaeria ovina]|uniref:FAD-binding domain-containing protein n=1 Tax=Lasiosphaeria ovina TaxID=92902 RepID=A0AAE0KCI3_9PEZI|nr:hypothetical protein B0T24DRAFT_288829 [Lasiosphaeria ovina]